MSVLVAVDAPHGPRLVDALEADGTEVLALVRPVDVVEATGDSASPVRDALRDADTVVLHATRAVLVPDVIAMCDRHGTRVVALADRAAERRSVAAFGLPVALPLDADLARLHEAITAPSLEVEAAGGDEPTRGSVTVVWGPEGAPGRTTIALALAAALSRSGRTVTLIDADAHAPSIAQRLDLPDEAPGFSAACRQTDYGLLDEAELTRLSAPVVIGRESVDVLTGINRPSRWPELSATRVAAALDVARDWADHVIVDVAAPLETDEEISSDVDAPRRNQAALAALVAADRILAVASADPVGLARFVRGCARLDDVAPTTPRVVAVNRVRTGPLGVDAPGQIRRALGRFAAVDDAWLLPDDPRAADRALLGSAPILPGRRARFAHAIDRLAATL